MLLKIHKCLFHVDALAHIVCFNWVVVGVGLVMYRSLPVHSYIGQNQIKYI